MTIERADAQGIRVKGAQRKERADAEAIQVKDPQREEKGDNKETGCRGYTILMPAERGERREYRERMQRLYKSRAR